MALPYQHSRSRLDNGLTVVTVAMPHLHSAHVALYARVGSRHEERANNGLSHFLEHMFFRGCEGYTTSTNLNDAVEDLGGTLDGYTTRDATAFHTTVHPDHVDDLTRIMGSMFLSPAFSDIDIERAIVLEEVLDALDERGRVIEIDTVAHRETFKDHPLGLSIDGPRKNIRRFQEDDLHAHRRRFYGAKNLVLCFAGNVKPKKCKRSAQRAFGPLFSGKRSRETAPSASVEPGRFTYVRCEDPQTRIRFSFRTVGDTHADHPAMQLVRRVLDGGLSSRLQVELVEKRGIAYEVAADNENYNDCGLLNFELAVAHKKLVYAIEELGQVLIELRSDGVQRAELDQVRRRARIGLELGLDSPAGLSHWFGATQLFHDPICPEKKMKQLEAVKPRAVHQAIRRYITGSRLSVAAVGGADVTTVRAARRAVKKLVEAL